MIHNVRTIPCLHCGESATFAMTEEQFNRFKSGEHVQNIFPDWSPEDREMLISGTCPAGWEEMWAEDEDEDYDDWEMTPNLLEPESGDFTYERDWYVD